MPYFKALPIMPKEARTSMSFSAASSAAAPYPQATAAAQRNAAIWTTADDEILLRARASGLNWQPIASKHFPNKTANACRKRHERLIERRHVDDWDSQKLELLAQEYLACRKEMWEMLAARLGERWNVVEAKCMEKGLKTLQTTARTAQRKASADQRQAYCEDRGISDHNSDSGIVLCSGSEPDMEVDETPPSSSRHGASASWSESYGRQPQQQQQQQHQHLQQEHMRSRSLPLPLPQYQPPPPRTAGKPQGRVLVGAPAASAAVATHRGPHSFEQPSYPMQRYSPETQHRFSIQSVLSPEEPQEAVSGQGRHDHDVTEAYHR